MRTLLALLGLAVVVLVVLMALGMVSIDQTREASLPKIRIEGGQAPQFKADVGSINVGTVNKTVEVPSIQVEKADNAAVAQ
ncbi:hypothetical protein [Sphingomonas sp.]|uniref:hypothetical protein n=1 Tax=Sphingomonas sp. TaxID=28214 RepID=UPI002C860FD1|nr:hypothetical protein [Sphingomonas sp.]HWK36369.1 hypothetical protein [Sphingomonas sp.]